MKAYHNTRDIFYKTPYGACPTGDTILLRIWTDIPSKVTARFWDGAEHLYPMLELGAFKDGYLYELSFTLPLTPTAVWYEFHISCEEGDFVYASKPERLGGEGMLYERDWPSFQITLYDAEYQTPDWLKSGLMYQIFVDRFAMEGDLRARRDDIIRHADWNEMPLYAPEGRTLDNRANDFFGGNLKGIISKLDYLQSLGVTVLYLNPVFRAASNHKYDIGDYLAIDPTFGDDEDFKALTAAAKEKGMRVILDGVFSHTGEDSVYFDRYGNYGGKGAYSDPNSPYRSWYTFTNYPEEYESWWGIPTLPEVREMEPGYQDFIIHGEDAVAAHWLRRGASGWRLDVADELPMEFLRDFRRRVKKENPEAAIIGEVWEDASRKVTYDQFRSYCLGDTVDSVMNYPLRDTLIQYLRGEITAAQGAEILSSLYENYSKPFADSLMNLVGSHDRARILNVLVGREGDGLSREQQRDLRLSEAERALAQTRLCRMLLFTALMPGIPCVYYGDEVGMEGAKDPFNRAPYPWGREDVRSASVYQKIFKLRKNLPQLDGGDVLVFAYGDILCVARTKGDNVALCAIAPGARHLTVLCEHFGCREVRDLHGEVYMPHNGLYALAIPEEGFAVFRND